MISIRQIFSLDLWVASGPLTKSGLIVLVSLASLFLIIAVVIKLFLLKRYRDDIFVRRLLKRVYKLSFTVSILSYIFIFFGYQGVPLLSFRFWYLIIFVLAVIWGLLIWRYWKQQMPLEKQRFQEDLSKKRYF